MSRILVVDDCEEMQALVRRALGPHFRLRSAHSLREARAELEREGVELVLLDVGLPDGDGYDLCASIRDDARTRSLPVLFLTGRRDVADKVMAFNLGGDDFIEKPFEPRELRARVRARLRRSRVGDVVESGGIRIDLSRFRAELLEGGGSELDLTAKELRLLHELMSKQGHVLSRAQLREAVWGETAVGERTIDTHIAQLRRKLGTGGRQIGSVRGVGYCFRACSAPERHEREDGDGG